MIKWNNKNQVKLKDFFKKHFHQYSKKEKENSQKYIIFKIMNYHNKI